MREVWEEGPPALGRVPWAGGEGGPGKCTMEVVGTPALEHIYIYIYMIQGPGAGGGAGGGGGGANGTLPRGGGPPAPNGTLSRGGGPPPMVPSHK